MPTATPTELGLDAWRLERLTDDVARQHYDGAVVLVGRRGAIALHAAIGFADRASGRRARTDDVFCIFSVTKAPNGFPCPRTPR
jgi:CubicO group peptidase (beta-lactamase class C family)